MKKKKTKGLGKQPETLPVENRPPRKQKFTGKAVEYLREGGNIEDLPDPEKDVAAEMKIRQKK